MKNYKVKMGFGLHLGWAIEGMKLFLIDYFFKKKYRWLILLLTMIKVR